MLTASPYPLADLWRSQGRGRPLDLCLRGRLHGPDVAGGVDALRGVLAGCDQFDAWVDGTPRSVAVDGGLRAYAEPCPDGGVDVYLHSSGEDAGEAIHEFSRLVASVLRRTAGDGTLSWLVLPSTRTDHRFSFDPPR